VFRFRQFQIAGNAQLARIVLFPLLKLACNVLKAINCRLMEILVLNSTIVLLNQSSML